MLSDVTAIRTYFAKLGLEEEIADIYLALHTYGPQTISQLARNARVERTRIYRLIDKLMDSNLVEVESQQKRGIIKAAPIANLHILIAQRELELKSLQDELGLIEQVLARNSLSSPALRVQFYEGIEGAKQMRQNITRAKSEVLSILSRDLHEETDVRFSRQWIKQCNQLDIHFRTLYDSHRPEDEHDNPHPKSWTSRYISKTPVTAYSTVTYDTVVASFHWKSEGVFGMEIYSDEVADAQRTYFEILWQQSQLEK